METNWRHLLRILGNACGILASTAAFPDPDEDLLRAIDPMSTFDSVGRLVRFQAALEAGADPNATDGGGQTALQKVVESLSKSSSCAPPASAIHEEMVRMLLAAGAELHPENDHPPPLVTAAEFWNVEMVRMLLAAGAEPVSESLAMATRSWRGSRCSSRERGAEVVRLLMEARGEGPLSISRMHDRAVIVYSGTLRIPTIF